MPLKTKPFNPAFYLKTDAARAAYMTEALETKDPAFIADAIGVLARSRGMSRVAKEVGLSRESLYRALSPKGNPEFATVLKVLTALHLQLKAAPGRSKNKGGALV
jgi:probable addiction module antidote protein